LSAIAGLQSDETAYRQFFQLGVDWCSACYIQIPFAKLMMISIVVRIPILVLFISLGACGVRGPLFIPNPPPVPPAPTQAEPKGSLYPPKDVPAKTTGSGNKVN
jgi:predicted small lipoprotein YifL